MIGDINMNNIIITEKEIDFNKRCVNFRYPIKTVENINEKYFILLKIPPRVELGEEELNNILCYDINGILLWRISNNLPNKMQEGIKVPYIAIEIVENNLKATDFMGRKFDVDISTGELNSLKIVR